MQRVPRDTNHRKLTQERTHFSNLNFSTNSLKELLLVTQKSNRCKSKAKRPRRAKLWWPVDAVLRDALTQLEQPSERACSVV
jgi:hypothetical protein